MFFKEVCEPQNMRTYLGQRVNVVWQLFNRNPVEKKIKARNLYKQQGVLGFLGAEDQPGTC